MKIDFRALRMTAAALLCGVVGMTSAGCSDDPAPAPPPRYAPITVLHAITDISGTPVQFAIGSTVIAPSVSYGNLAVAPTALVGGGTEVKAQTLDGTTLGTANVNIDTNRSVWVVVAGTALNQKASVFGASHLEPTVPAGRAVLRVIHASANAPKIDVHETDALGSEIASDLEFKGAGDFKSISPTVATLSVTRAADNTELLPITIDPPLVAGKIYNLVIYGSTEPTAADPVKLTAKILEEPS